MGQGKDGHAEVFSTAVTSVSVRSISRKVISNSRISLRFNLLRQHFFNLLFSLNKGRFLFTAMIS